MGKAREIEMVRLVGFVPLEEQILKPGESGFHLGRGRDLAGVIPRVPSKTNLAANRLQPGAVQGFLANAKPKHGLSFRKKHGPRHACRPGNENRFRGDPKILSPDRLGPRGGRLQALEIPGRKHSPRRAFLLGAGGYPP